MKGVENPAMATMKSPVGRNCWHVEKADRGVIVPVNVNATGSKANLVALA